MNNIKKAREAKNLSQKQVAIELNVSPPTVSEWESGKKFPCGKRLIKLSDLFGVSIDYLLGKPEASEKSELESTLLSQFEKGIEMLTFMSGSKINDNDKERYWSILKSGLSKMFFNEDMSELDKEFYFEIVTEAFLEYKKLKR